MTFLEILILIVIAVVGIIAVRISFNFDINKFLENRRKIKLEQLKNICPHGEVISDGNKFMFKSYFSSPRGTIQWRCRQCGLIVDSEEDVENLSKSITPEVYMKKHKMFHKQAKKLKIY